MPNGLCEEDAGGVGEASLAGSRSRPRPQVQWLSAMVLTCGCNATGAEPSAMPSVASCVKGVGQDQLDVSDFYDQLKTLNWEVFQIGYKKRNHDSPRSSLLRHDTRG